MVNSVSTTFICPPFASPPTNSVGVILGHQDVDLLLHLGVASRTLFFSLQGRSCLGNSFQITLTTQCKLHAHLENCIRETAGHCFYFLHQKGELSQSTEVFYRGISLFLRAFFSVGNPGGYPLRASPVIHPPFQALTTSSSTQQLIST